MLTSRLARQRGVLRAVHPNGLTVLVRRDRTAPAVAIVTHVRAGYFDETDDVVGIAHVLEHMYFKGTPTRGVGEIARATKATGGYLNAHTIYDHTSYYTVVPSAGFAEALAIQADAYANSAIDADELAKEIEVIVAGGAPQGGCAVGARGGVLYALLYDQHRMRRWRMGRPMPAHVYAPGSSASTATSTSPATLCSASWATSISMRSTARSRRSTVGCPMDLSLARPGPSRVDSHRASRSTHGTASGAVISSETQVVLGWRTVPTLHTDTPLLDLAAMVLGAGRGSRLYRGVRERRLASSAACPTTRRPSSACSLCTPSAPADRAGRRARSGPSSLTS